MSPVTHFLGSWLVAAVTTANPRDRLLVTLAGVIPDADGLGLVVDAAQSLTSGQTFHYYYYQQYHHVLLHGWPGALAVGLILMAFARQKPKVLFWCLVTFHLHLLCDLIGSRGPDLGDLWPICYSEPFFRHPIWFWKGQWRLDGWQNILICLGVLGFSLWLAVRQGYSFVSLFNRRAEAAFVRVLRQWFGSPRDPDSLA